MKVLIISDLHANLEAVEALPKDFDQLWVLGDLVNYGPNPAEVVEFVRANASGVVRGNHDHAIGLDEDPHCSAPFRRMAEETCRYTRSVLEEQHREYLRGLPLTATAAADGRRVLLCHATPSDPLFAYRPRIGSMVHRRGGPRHPGGTGGPHAHPVSARSVWPADRQPRQRGPAQTRPAGSLLRNLAGWRDRSALGAI